MDTVLEDSKLCIDRPAWPFALAAVGGVVLAIGASIIAVSYGREVPASKAILGLALVPSSLLLAVAGSVSMTMSDAAVEGLLIMTFAMFALLGIAIALEVPALRRRAEVVA
jgi:hypothetical protein